MTTVRLARSMRWLLSGLLVCASVFVFAGCQIVKVQDVLADAARKRSLGAAFAWSGDGAGLERTDGVDRETFTVLKEYKDKVRRGEIERQNEEAIAMLQDFPLEPAGGESLDTVDPTRAKAPSKGGGGGRNNWDRNRNNWNRDNWNRNNKNSNKSSKSSNKSSNKSSGNKVVRAGDGQKSGGNRIAGLSNKSGSNKSGSSNKSSGSNKSGSSNKSSSNKSSNKSGSSKSSGGSKGSSNQRELLALHNAQRKKVGVGSLQMNSSLNQAAQRYANYLNKSGKFSHTAKGSPGSRMAAAGYQGGGGGENIAKGYGSNSSATKGWMKSSGHKANILNKGYKAVGFGVSGSVRVTVFGSKK